jgi:RNA polymerase sigma-54 factor
MQISQNLKLKQSQSLVMTPQLQQAIKLLQLNNLELSNLINKELEENPFLENESSEEYKERSDDNTEDLSDSFSSGESISDEPKSDGIQILFIHTKIKNLTMTPLILAQFWSKLCLKKYP